MDKTGKQLDTVYLQRWATIGLPCSWDFYSKGVNMDVFAPERIALGSPATPPC
jgi:hypothetical protein